jgi:hypothetical protein
MPRSVAMWAKLIPHQLGIFGREVAKIPVRLLG